MEHAGDLILQVEPAPDSDVEEVAELTQRLRDDLLGLDVESVDPIDDPAQPAGAKGLETLVGWLAVRLGKEALRTAIGHPFLLQHLRPRNMDQ